MLLSNMIIVIIREARNVFIWYLKLLLRYGILLYVFLQAVFMFRWSLCIVYLYKIMNEILISDDVSDKRNSLSYVIINPSYDLKLELNDIM